MGMGVKIAIIFNGILEDNEIDQLSTFLKDDPDVNEFVIDTAEVVIESKPAIEDGVFAKTVDCTSLLVDLKKVFPIGFKMRFEMHSGGRLERSTENPYVYFYVV